MKRPFGRVFFLVFLGIASHVVIDDLARLTYHPPQAMKEDLFWVGYHIFAVVATLACLIVWRRYLAGMLCAVLPDLDWIIRPLARVLGWEWWKEGALHAFCRGLPGLAQIDGLLQKLPNWTGIPAASLNELIFASLLMFLYWATREEMVSEGIK